MFTTWCFYLVGSRVPQLLAYEMNDLSKCEIELERAGAAISAVTNGLRAKVPIEAVAYVLLVEAWKCMQDMNEIEQFEFAQDPLISLWEWFEYELSLPLTMELTFEIEEAKYNQRHG